MDILGFDAILLAFVGWGSKFLRYPPNFWCSNQQFEKKNNNNNSAATVSERKLGMIDNSVNTRKNKTLAKYWIYYDLFTLGTLSVGI